MTFKEIQAMMEGKSMPCSGTNEKDEVVIIELQNNNSYRCFRLMTFQHNDWVRHNYIYETNY